MAKKKSKKTTKRKTKKAKKRYKSPDGLGERPTDPIEFAKWLVDRTTRELE
jgi:hypothetical protein